MAGITSAAIGLGLSAYQISQAEKDKKNARNAINNYERQTVDNAYENVSISNLGSDLLKEESQRRSAGMVDALQGGGIRGVVGGIPKVVASMNAADMQAAKILDDQYINREYAIAGDNARIEGIRENRDNMNISALSSQYDAGRKESMNGMYGVASSLAMGAREYERDRKNPSGGSGANPYDSANSGMMYNYPQEKTSPYYLPFTAPYL